MNVSTRVLGPARSLGLRAVVVTFVALAALIGSSATTLAPAANAATLKYGALSIGMLDGSGGYAYDYSTRDAAVKNSVWNCKKRANKPEGCKHAVTVKNGCAAIYVRLWSTGKVRYYGWGTAFYRGDAQKRAKQECGSSCRSHSWVCTTRYRTR